jgi:hypothetical protein
MKLTLSFPAISRSEKVCPGASAPERIERRSSSVTRSVTDRAATGLIAADCNATN